MSIKLQKKQTISLTKADTSNNICIGAGWTTGQKKADLDLAVWGLGSDGKALNEQYLVFYNTEGLSSPCGAIRLKEDNRTGEGDGDDEVAYISLDKLPTEVKSVLFTLTGYEHLTPPPSFGSLGMTESYIRLFKADASFNEVPNSEIARLNLLENFPNNNGIIFGAFERQEDNSWKFTAIGSGVNKGLAGLIEDYGLTLE